jgi:hypothetical protein
MFSKKNILLIGGTVLLAYFLFRKKESNKIVPTGQKKLVEFEPIDVQPMPWVAIPNYFPEVK